MSLFAAFAFRIIVQALFDMVGRCRRAEDKVCNMRETKCEILVGGFEYR